LLLAGKNAVVTGCNRGIGKSIVELFAAEGANIWAHSRKFSADFEAFCQTTAQKYNVWIKPVYFELSSEEEIRTGIKTITGEKSKIEILVNNAGISSASLMMMMPVSACKSLFDINFFAPLLLIQLLSRKMIQQKNGCIINIASIAGMEGYKGLSAYGSSKAALIHLTKTLASELGEYNIRVNAVSPGFTETGMVSYKTDSVKEGLIANTYLKRMADPREIANAVLFLASDLSSYLTGQVIRVDGGK
jgi:3-oxoacyl-[acyl-carrier protein] reductase